ncbi:MAG: DUF5671 domain-containing protein [Dehalococcoidia bacterium]
MFFIFGILQLLIPLAVIGGIVYAVVAWRRREGLETDAEADRGIGTVKRLYFYVASFASLMVAANGVVLMGRYVLEALFGPQAISLDQGMAALGVALTVIWAPVWGWHWLRVQRYVKEEPVEQHTLLRPLYLYLTLGVAIGFVTFGAVQVLRWAFGAGSFPGYPLAALIVWSGLWLYHWRVATLEGEPTPTTQALRRLYLYLTSASSLAMLAVGAGLAIHLVFREAYEGITSLPVLLRGEEGLWGSRMQTALSVAIVGAGIWTWHWLHAARLDTQSMMRQFYAYVFAILGGVVTVLVATGIIVGLTLVWLIGVPDEATATAHFRFLPGALSPLLVGLGLWFYHWMAVQREQAVAGQLAIARRTYAYIMAALGLGALAGAIIVLVPTVIGIGVTSARDVLVGEDWWRNRIVLALTLGLVGTPIWGYYWFAMQRQAALAGAAERANLPRRLLIYGAVGIGTLAILGSASHLLFLFLDALLEDELSLALLREAKWSMGVIAAAACFVPYSWLVLREDRLLTAAEEPAAAPRAVAKAVTVLVGEDGGPFIEELEKACGRRVRVLHRLDPGSTAPDIGPRELAGLAERIALCAGSRVLVVADAMELKLFSYR